MSEDIISNKSDGRCAKIPWIYDIGVINGNELRIEKIISIWKKNGAEWTRQRNLRIPLNWRVKYLDGGKIVSTSEKNIHDYVSMEDNCIVFKGGFLEVDDPGLVAPLAPYDIPFNPKNIVKSQLIDPDCPELKLDIIDFQDILKLVQISLAHVGLGRIIPSGSGESDSPENSHSPDIDTQNQIVEKIVARLNPVGKNIHLEVDIKEAVKPGFNPLFYFPQNDENEHSESNFGDVYLGFNLGSENDYQYYWQISGQQPLISESTYLKDNGAGLLSVTQDINWFSILAPTKEEIKQKKAYFEVMIDGIALHHNESFIIDSREKEESGERVSGRKKSGEFNSSQSELPGSDYSRYVDNVVNHPFGNGSRKFYIGYANKRPEGIYIPGQRQHFIFRGAISRCVFDPNAACPNCPP